MRLHESLGEDVGPNGHGTGDTPLVAVPSPMAAEAAVCAAATSAHVLPRASVASSLSSTLARAQLWWLLLSLANWPTAALLSEMRRLLNQTDKHSQTFRDRAAAPKPSVRLVPPAHIVSCCPRSRRVQHS